MRNDTKLDLLWDDVQELKASGGGGSELPDVTAADNGKILGVVNGAWNKMDAPAGGLDYSTSEQDTGRKWIDGKEIFQRTIVVENFDITSQESPFKYGSFNIDALIPGIDYLWIDNEASHIIQDGNQRQFVYGEYQGSDGLFIYSVATRTSCTLYVTVLYTKATTTKKKTTKNKED